MLYTRKKRENWIFVILKKGDLWENPTAPIDCFERLKGNKTALYGDLEYSMQTQIDEKMRINPGLKFPQVLVGIPTNTCGNLRILFEKSWKIDILNNFK